MSTTATTTYANDRPILTPVPSQYQDRSTHEAAYKQGQVDALARFWEEIPPDLRPLIARMRSLITRPQAHLVHPSFIAQHLAYEFRDTTFDEA